MGIPEETRRESYQARPIARKKEIIKFVAGRDMTSRQIAYGMGYTDLNAVKPRISEMRKTGEAVPIDKVIDEESGRKVTLWRIGNV